MSNNNYGSGDFIIDRLLSDINEKLHSNKLNILSERREIQKAEDLLSQFKKTAEQQNNDLNIFMEKGEQLEEEISKYFGYNFSGESSNGQINGNICISTDELMPSERIVLKRKYPIVLNHNWDDKVNLSDKDNSNVTDNSKVLSTLRRKQSKKEIILKQFELETLKNVTVYSILTRYDFGFFVGGSEGFLMRYFNNEEHVYRTDTDEDIIQIEAMMQFKNVFLVAFTKSKLFIFDHLTDDEPYKEIHLAGMKSVHNDGTLLYITLDNGKIKKINKTNWVVCDYLDNKYAKGCVLFPSTINSQYFLVTLKDKVLYKTMNKNLSVLQRIPGISNVKKVLKMRNISHLCYSDSMVWILDRHCDILDCIPFKNGIKIVERDKEHGVVVDNKNVIHVYYVLYDGNFGEKILEKQMAGVVTAITLKSETIFVAVCDIIFSFDFVERCDVV